MHVLFATLPAHGHTYPLIPLARAVAARGHRVTFATGAAFHPLMAKLGFDTADAGLGMHEAFGRALAAIGDTVDFTDPNDPIRPLAVTRVFGEVQPRAVVGELGPALDLLKPDLVVYEIGNPGAAIAAKARGIPVISHAIGQPGILEDFDGFAAHLASVAADAGVDLSADPSLLADPYLDIFPPSLLGPTPRAARTPLRPVAFAEPGELPAWVTEHERPLVYLTLGTAFGNPDVLRRAITGLAALPVRVLVAAGPTVDTEELRDVPDSVTVLPWVPQADLLPHVDLVVHHGGSGTTLGSLAEGLPQLFLPQGADQFVNAEALTAAGIARTLIRDAATPEAITEAAGALLKDEQAAVAARAVAAEIAAMPSPEETAEALVEIAR